MPGSPFNISYNASTGWNCTPPRQTVLAGTNVTFKNSAKSGCIIAFENSATFGQSSLAVGKASSETRAATGVGTRFGVRGAKQVSRARGKKDPYPFEVTIGSGILKEEGLATKAAGQ